MNSVPGSNRGDPHRGIELREEGWQHLKQRKYDLAILSFESAIAVYWPSSDNDQSEYHWLRARAYELKMLDGPMIAFNANREGNQMCRAGIFISGIFAYGQAFKFDSEFLLAPNNLAWVLATCPDKRIRDGQRAVELAAYVCRKSKWHDWGQINTQPHPMRK